MQLSLQQRGAGKDPTASVFVNLFASAVHIHTLDQHLHSLFLPTRDVQYQYRKRVTHGGVPKQTPGRALALRWRIGSDKEKPRQRENSTYLCGLREPSFSQDAESLVRRKGPRGIDPIGKRRRLVLEVSQRDVEGQQLDCR